MALVLFAGNIAAETKELGSQVAAGRAYRSRVITLIGNAWSESVLRRPTGLSAGTVRVEFDITSSGRARDIRVIAKPQDKASADLLRDLLRKLTFPPIPPALLRELPDQRIPVELNFNLTPPTR